MTVIAILRWSGANIQYLAWPEEEAASGLPTVTVKNGSYSGVFSPEYDQDFFLGMRYAQVRFPDAFFGRTNTRGLIRAT